MVTTASPVRTQRRLRLRGGEYALSVALALAFAVATAPHLDTLYWDYDEGWFILGARFIQQGQRPFLDFIHHQPPLHLYLLALFGKLFGSTLAGYRLLSVSSIALSSVLLFCLTRPFVGVLAALIAQVFFLFSLPQIYVLCALPEAPTAVFTLIGAIFLLTNDRPWTAYVSGAAFTLGLLIKPTSVVVVLAAVLSVSYARDWRRFAHFAVAGFLAAALGLAWMLWVSDGGFADVLRVQATRAYTRQIGMWSVDSGFADIRRLAGAETRLQWAVVCFESFFKLSESRAPLSIFAASMLGLGVWIVRIVRARPALRAYSLLWPVAYCGLNFFLLDFVADEKFTPFLVFSGVGIAGLVWLVQRLTPTPVVAAAGALALVVLSRSFTATLGEQLDPWYYRRARDITREHPVVVSFSPMLFAVTGTDPGCGFWNPINTYGHFAEAVGTERTRPLRYTDERIRDCLKANPSIPLVVDWGFYFFTRPGSPLRVYLAGEGARQRIFFSRQAEAQWDDPVLSMRTDR